MLQLLASPQFGLLPAPSFPVITTSTVISRGHLFDIEMAHKDKPSSRGSDLKMSHKNKPARYAERRPGYMPASSHSKTQPKWRHTPDVSLSAAASAIPALPTDKLPPPVDGQRIPVGRYPALVLNADYTPLSYVPLSLWSWQDTVKAVFREADKDKSGALDWESLSVTCDAPLGRPGGGILVANTPLPLDAFEAPDNGRYRRLRISPESPAAVAPIIHCTSEVSGPSGTSASAAFLAAASVATAAEEEDEGAMEIRTLLLAAAAEGGRLGTRTAP